MKKLHYSNRGPVRQAGFSFVELLAAIAIIGFLSGLGYLFVGTAITHSRDSRVKNDLKIISIALHDYQKSNLGTYPVPESGGNSNVLCFTKDAIYTHDCDTSIFRRARVDNILLSKRYLQKVPTDPRTASSYVYGVSTDGRYYQIAGVKYDGENGREAMTIENADEGFYLPSLIRAYDSSDFVVNGGHHLPYGPDADSALVTLRNTVGTVLVNVSQSASSGMTLQTGDTIETQASSSTDIYFPDGSYSHLSESSQLEILPATEVEQNDKDGIITKIRLKLTSGKIWNKVVRLASESEFNIETTSAIAGVRGTEFGIDANTDKLIVFSGEVGVCQKSNPSCTVIISKNDFTVPQTAHTKILTGDPLVYDMTNPVQKGSGAVPTPAEQTYIDSLHQSDLLHSGMVVHILGAASPNNDPADYDVYFAFNGKNSDKIKFGGLEIYGGSQLNGAAIRKDQNGDLLVPLFVVQDLNPNDINPPVDYISNIIDPHYKRYHINLDYSSNGPFMNTFMGRPEDIAIRAYRCNDPSLAPDCPMTERIHSSFSRATIGFYKDPQTSDQTASALYTNPILFPALSLHAFINGPKEVPVNMPATYDSVISNLSDPPKTVQRSWSIEEKPSLSAIATMDKNTGVFNAQTPGKYLIWHGVTEDHDFDTLAESFYMVEVIAQNPQVTCQNMNGYWNGASTCFGIAAANITIGETKTFALTNIIGLPAPAPACGWTLGVLSGDAALYTSLTVLNSGTGSFTAPWATGSVDIKCQNLPAIATASVPIGQGDYTLVAGFTDSLPAQPENADFAIGNALPDTTSNNFTVTSSGLKITPGDGNYLAYSAQNNMPATGSLEIELNKLELINASYSYLFEAVDDNGKHVEVYKTSLGALTYKVGNKKCGFSGINSALNNMGNDLKMVFQWDTTTIDMEVFDENNDKVSNYISLQCLPGSPPALSFNNASTRIYVGSRENGAVSTEINTLNDPLQYPGYIKSIKIRQ